MEETRKPYRFKTKPTPHQAAALKKALKRGSLGVFFEQRVGKTKVAIDFIGAKNLWEGKNRVLILCPLSAVGVWQDQIDQHLPDEIQRRVVVYTGETPEPDKRLTVLIAHYWYLSNGDHWKKLREWGPHIVVADECHLLKNPGSRRSQRAAKIGERADYRLGLTGTPLSKHRLRDKPIPRYEDLFGQFRFIDPSLLGTRYADFKDRYMIFGGYMNYEVLGYRNVKELQKRVARAQVRVMRRDVMKEPEQEHVVVPVEVDNRVREMYNQFERDSVLELRNAEKEIQVIAPIVLTLLMRLQQLTGGFTVADVANRSDVTWVHDHKLKVAADLVDTAVAGGSPVLVVCKYLPEIRRLSEALSGTGIKTGTYTGDMSQGSREAALEEFKSGHTQVLVMQQRAGGMGIDLSVASTVVLYSLEFGLTDYEQVLARVLGRYQTSPVVTYYYPVVKGTIDEVILNSLRMGVDVVREAEKEWRRLLPSGNG